MFIEKNTNRGQVSGASHRAAKSAICSSTNFFSWFSIISPWIRWWIVTASSSFWNSLIHFLFNGSVVSFFMLYCPFSFYPVNVKMFEKAPWEHQFCGWQTWWQRRWWYRDTRRVWRPKQGILLAPLEIATLTNNEKAKPSELVELIELVGLVAFIEQPYKNNWFSHMDNFPRLLWQDRSSSQPSIRFLWTLLVAIFTAEQMEKSTVLPSLIAFSSFFENNTLFTADTLYTIYSPFHFLSIGILLSFHFHWFCISCHSALFSSCHC